MAYIENEPKSTKICTRCSELKNINDFYSQTKTKANGTKYVYHHPECKECSKKGAKKWIQDNRDRHNEISRKRNSNLSTRYTRKKHRENNKEYYTNYRRVNKEKVKGYVDKRQFHKKHSITKEEWMLCKKYFDNCCAYCGLHESEHYIPYLSELRKQDLHKEHVIHDGSNDLSNCVPSCQSCNSRKHTQHLEDWYTNENPSFSQDGLDKIYKWLKEDYLMVISN